MRRRLLDRLVAAHERFLEEKAGAFACWEAGTQHIGLDNAFDLCDRSVVQLLHDLAPITRREGMSYAAARVQHASGRQHVVLSRAT